MMHISDERILELMKCMEFVSEAVLKQEDKQLAQKMRRDFRDIVSLLTEYLSLCQENERLRKEVQGLEKELLKLCPKKKFKI